MATVKVPGGFTINAGSGAVWVPMPDRGVVARIDPVTNKVVATVTINDPSKLPRQVSVPGQRVLVGHGEHVCGPDGDVGNLERVLVDPDTDEVRGLVIRRAEPRSRPLTVPAS